MAPSLQERKAAHKRKTHAKQYTQELLVVGDLLVTTLWVLLSSVFGEVAEVLAAYSGFGEFALALGVTVTAIILIGPLCDAFGGALFNPIHNAAYIVAGKGSTRFNVIRMVAQIAGALAGSFLAVTLLPAWLQEDFNKLQAGLQDGMHVGQGIAAEALLGLILNVVVLWAGETQHKRLGYWTPIAATVVLIVGGAQLGTGPSMNPAITFSWYYHHQGYDVIEHVLVYWLAPFLGAILGGLLFRAAWAEAGGTAKALPLAKKAGGGGKAAAGKEL